MNAFSKERDFKQVRMLPKAGAELLGEPQFPTRGLAGLDAVSRPRAGFRRPSVPPLAGLAVAFSKSRSLSSRRRDLFLPQGSRRSQ